MTIKTEVSFGEFLDKITILEIKSERIKDSAKLTNINLELNLLNTHWQQHPKSKIDINNEIKQLKTINEKLWEIEDDIRRCEKEKDFSQRFLDLARAVYINNDQRALLKRKINTLLKSDMFEEKSYEDYS